MVVREDAGDAHTATAWCERMNASTTIGVERAAGAFADPGPRIVHRQPRPVRPVARKRVEDVGNRDDAPLERDLRALEAARIAASVPPLVMRPGDRRGQLEQLAARAAEQVAPDLRVLLHQRALVVGQLAGLAQDALPDGDLADVVQRCSETKQLHLRLGQAEGSCDAAG